MEKLQLKIPVILPQVPNEKDSCVERLIQKLQAKEGIEKVHIADANGDDVPQLCFHYDPDIISIDRIQSLAESTGAEITEKYGHLLIEVKGIRHTRQARSIEKSLLAINGVLEASVSGSGMVRLEFDKKQTNFDEISKQIEKEDLQIQRSSSNENDYTEASKKNRSVQRRKILKSKLPQRDTSTKKARPTRKEKSTPTVGFSVKIRSLFFPLSVGHFSG